MSPEAAAAAADRVLTTMAGIKRWRSVRLVAIGTNRAWGEGTEVTDSMEAHPMWPPGRR